MYRVCSPFFKQNAMKNVSSLFQILLLSFLLNEGSVSALVQDRAKENGDQIAYTIGLTKKGVVHVKIEKTLKSDALVMAHYQASNGASNDEFISNAVVATAKDVSEMEYMGRGRWSTSPAKAGDQVTIEYDLSLELGHLPWPNGREEIGFAVGDGAFLVSRATMLADYGDSEQEIKIKFECIDSAAPWQQVKKNQWLAKNLDAFHNNCFAFGSKFGRKVAETKQGQVTFIHDAESTELANQAAKDIAPALEHTTSIFGSFPVSNYHIFLFHHVHPEGAAFNDSFAMLHPAPIQDVDALIWRHGFIHEINHLWVGRRIRPAPGEDIEWFKEGVADYLAIKTMWQLGYVDIREFESKLENLMRRHTMGLFMSGGKVPLIKAGANKSKNKLIIYGSGGTWAFMLDVEMSAKQGVGAFEKMLADLYENSEAPYTHERLMARMNKTSEGAAGRLLGQFNRNLMPTSFPDLLEPYGIELGFMMPDMFELDLNSTASDRNEDLPAFIRQPKAGKLQ